MRLSIHCSDLIHRFAMPILELLINEITQYVLFCFVFFLLNLILHFIPVVTYISSSFLIHSQVDGHLGCVQFGAIMNKATMDISVQVFW